MDFEGYLMTCYVTISQTDSKGFCLMVICISDWGTVTIGVPQGSTYFGSFALCFIYQ